jgi:GT2 family glycosyltransferase
MDISVVILTYDQPQLLPQCVASCVREINEAGLRGEIILIDNGSQDGTPQRVAAHFPEVRLIRNERGASFAAGNNRGIRAGTGRLVMLLNDDAVLEQGALRVMVEALDSNPKMGAVGPKLLNPDGSTQHYYTNCRFPRFHSLMLGWLELTPLLEKRAWSRDLLTHYRDQEISSETDWVGGACLLARRNDLEAVGLLDESYYFGMEDIDLCYRLKQQGWKVVYLAEARVTHYASASLKKLRSIDRKIINLRALLVYEKKHTSFPRYLLFRMIILTGLAFFHIPSAVISEMRQGVPAPARRGWLFPLRSLLRHFGEIRGI